MNRDRQSLVYALQWRYISVSSAMGNCCGSCESKRVTLRVVNDLKEPRFEITHTLKDTLKMILLGMMEEAADADVSFRSCESKRVTLRVVNDLKEPRFEITHTLKDTRERNLLGMMEEAADADVSFRFTVTYYGSTLGYFVNAYNKVFGDFERDKSYWEILDGEMEPTPCGVSNYVPKDKEVVTFKLTVGGRPS